MECQELEEGDNCPKCKEGELKYTSDGGCSCHLNPPCAACTNSYLQCNYCMEEFKYE